MYVDAKRQDLRERGLKTPSPLLSTPTKTRKNLKASMAVIMSCALIWSVGLRWFEIVFIFPRQVHKFFSKLCLVHRITMKFGSKIKETS